MKVDGEFSEPAVTVEVEAKVEVKAKKEVEVEGKDAPVAALRRLR